MYFSSPLDTSQRLKQPSVLLHLARNLLSWIRSSVSWVRNFNASLLVLLCITDTVINFNQAEANWVEWWVYTFAKAATALDVHLHCFQLAEAANRLNIPLVILDSSDAAPAKQLVSLPDHPHVAGPFTSASHIEELCSKVDVLTVEIEHVDAQALLQLQSKFKSSGGRSGKGVAIHPSPQVILTIQDKYTQKVHLAKHGIALADAVAIEAGSDKGTASIQAAAQSFGLPLMLKSRTMAYDGRGNYVLKTLDDIPAAIEALGGGSRPLYAERFAPFNREIAVMVVRSADGQVQSYPAVETVHRDNICHLVHAPLTSRTPGLSLKARLLAEKAVAALGEGAVGIFGVEMFEMPGSTSSAHFYSRMLLIVSTCADEVLINEIAPRPHNSGHYTIEACATSQYENHLRAILSLPLGDPSLKVGASSMLNLLGGHSPEAGSLTAFIEGSLKVPGCTAHLYGKGLPRLGRKMGHVTVVGSSLAEVSDRMRPLLESLPAPYNDNPPALPPAGFSHPQPLVSIIMGSDSDLPVMKTASTILQQFDIPHELEIVSAHRTPALMAQFAASASERGVRVIIAGAGGAAHLPGMVAAQTPLPVIGVPVKGSTLDGVDSLHSIVQMPVGLLLLTLSEFSD